MRSEMGKILVSFLDYIVIFNGTHCIFSSQAYAIIQSEISPKAKGERLNIADEAAVTLVSESF